MQVYRIDKEGFYVRPVLIKYNDKLPDDCIETRPQNGMYKPKWDGDKWVEGLSQEEIDEIRNRPKEPTEEELLKQRVDDLEMFILTYLELI